MSEKRCGAIIEMAVGTWRHHLCGRKRGHKGRHRCGELFNATYLTKATTCGFKWRRDA